jgi:hypothetical protein
MSELQSILVDVFSNPHSPEEREVLTAKAIKLMRPPDPKPEPTTPLTAKERYAAYLATTEWRARRISIIRRDKKRCTECGSKRRLQVHHKTYERVGEELPEDLITLCDDCHCKAHGLPSPHQQMQAANPQEPQLSKRERAKRAHQLIWAKLYDPTIPADARRLRIIALHQNAPTQERKELKAAFQTPGWKEARKEARKNRRNTENVAQHSRRMRKRAERKFARDAAKAARPVLTPPRLLEVASVREVADHIRPRRRHRSSEEKAAFKANLIAMGQAVP